MATTPTDRLRALHARGTFVIPNPFDVGSARLLAAMGFDALATTSSGLAASLGRPDMTIELPHLLEHVVALAGATDLPLHVDAERGFADDPAGVARTVLALADAGAAGCSIEDWDPAAERIEPFGSAVERVAAAADAAASLGVVVTARCEHHLRGVDDLTSTIERLVAYRDAGAEVLYAPGLRDLDQIERVVEEVEAPVNVLLLPDGPSVDELTSVGVRRISLGGRLSGAAYGAAVAQAASVLDTGTIETALPRLDPELAQRAFDP